MGEVQEEGKRLSYKFRLYPNKEQERYFAINFGCVRFVYNHFLDARIKSYEATKETLYDGTPNPNYDPSVKPMTRFAMSKALTVLKKETIDEDGHRWLYDADSIALTYAILHLDRAYQNFFRRVKRGEKPGFPKFKSRYSRQSFTVGNCKIIDDRHISLPKIGKVKTKITREVKGEIVNATVSKNSAGQYYVSINVKGADIAPLPEKDNAVGITMGVREWVVTSDGEVFDNPRTAKKMERKLAREQRKLARKVPGSANYTKQKVKVARVYNDISNIRSYETHGLTRELVNENGAIISRDMKVADMLQSDNKVAGKKLGKRAKAKINRAVTDANFFEINRQLAYKSDWAGREFVLVPPDTPTAQVCATCGYRHVLVARNLHKEWVCPECQTVHDRKYNGAKNVLEAGLDILHAREDAYITKETKKARAEREEKKAQKKQERVESESDTMGEASS